VVEPIELTLRFENLQKDGEQVYFGFDQRHAGRNNWILQDDRGQSVPKTAFGRRPSRGSSGPVTAKTILIALNRYFDLSLPGTYRVALVDVGVSTNISGGLGERQRTRSNFKGFRIDDTIHRPDARRPTGDEIYLEGEAFAGFQFGYSLRKRRYAIFEPIDLVLRVTNVAQSDRGIAVDGIWPTVYYVLELENPQAHYKAALTRFGKSTTICGHVTKPGRDTAKSHEDAIVVNQFYDLSVEGNYRLKASAKVRHPEGDDAIELRAPEVEFVVSSLPMIETEK
jgi:hypothetical protein